MTIILFIKQALSSIFGNKLRSFLSTLGIMIGISSFVIMLAIGEGAKESITKGMGDEGSIINLHKNIRSDKSEVNKLFTKKTKKILEEKVPGTKKIILEYNIPSWEMLYNGKNFWGNLNIFGKGDFDFYELKIAYGSSFTESDFKNAQPFVLLGSKMIEKPEFGGENPMAGIIPIGKTINIGGQAYIVKGILENKNGFFDYGVFITDIMYLRNVSNSDINSFKIYAKDEKVVENLKKKLKYFLSKKISIQKDEVKPYNIRTNEEMIKSMNEMSQKFSLLLGGIGAIALIVGGIGIMNIMVVSVTERTREIGIRKAIGATNKNILFQFLIESIILTLFGTAFAIGFSYGVVKLLGKYIPNFNPTINSFVLFLAIAVAVSMGIIFGLMPAYKAARLKPIDALHFE